MNMFAFSLCETTSSLSLPGVIQWCLFWLCYASRPAYLHPFCIEASQLIIRVLVGWIITQKYSRTCECRGVFFFTSPILNDVAWSPALFLLSISINGECCDFIDMKSNLALCVLTLTMYLLKLTILTMMMKGLSAGFFFLSSSYVYDHTSLNIKWASVPLKHVLSAHSIPQTLIPVPHGTVHQF